MTRTAEIQDLYNFNRWANARTRAAVAMLSPEQLAQDMKSSFPSVRETMLHIMASEWVWLTRWLGSSPAAMPEAWRSYDFMQIAKEWEAIEAAQRAFLDNLSEADLDRIINYRNFRGEDHSNALWQLLRHLVNHSTYHRGQVTTMLRQLGAEAVATDLVLYFRQQV
jgi:uncharacterized damage-inducible protein DinB